MIGGLIVSTILTLFIIPVIYYTIFRKSYRADGTACNTPEKLTATEPT
jgi:hypothetical protein